MTLTSSCWPLEVELQELVDRLDRVRRKYSLLINVDKTKVMASDGIACLILIQYEQLELHIYRYKIRYIIFTCAKKLTRWPAFFILLVWFVINLFPFVEISENF